MCLITCGSLEGWQNKGQQKTMPLSLGLNKNLIHLGSGELHLLTMLHGLLPHIMARRNKSCLHKYTGSGLQEAYAWHLLDSALCTSSLWYFILHPVTVTNHNHNIMFFSEFCDSICYSFIVFPVLVQAQQRIKMVATLESVSKFIKAKCNHWVRCLRKCKQVCQSKSVIASILKWKYTLRGRGVALLVGSGPAIYNGFPFISPCYGPEWRPDFFSLDPLYMHEGKVLIGFFLGHIRSSDWTQAGYLICMGEVPWKVPCLGRCLFLLFKAGNLSVLEVINGLFWLTRVQFPILSYLTLLVNHWPEGAIWYSQNRKTLQNTGSLYWTFLLI